MTKSSILDGKIKGAKFWELDGTGCGTEVTEEHAKASKSLIWMQLTTTAAKKIFNATDTPTTIREILTKKDPRPRTIALQDSLIGIYRGINFNKGESPENMISIRIWLHKNKIITIQRKKSATLNEIEQAFKQGIGPKDSAEFLQEFLEIISDKSTETLSKLGDKLDALEQKLNSGSAKVEQNSINDMQRRIILLRRYLIPQREAIARIPIGKISWLSSFGLLQLQEISNTNLRMIEDLDAERDRARIISEGISNKAQESINQKMYLLSIVAVIFMPLGFLAGVFGMNLGGIPGLDYKFGFTIVCILMFALFLIQIVFLKYKRWI
jgi:zinc transporter